MLNPASLSVPPKTVAPSSPGIVRAKQAEAWLAQLPVTNPAEAAKRLYQSLRALNRAHVEPASRLEVMELYAPVALSLDEALQVHLQRVALPLNFRQKQLADFLRQFANEMAYGYKAVLHDVLAERGQLKKEWLPRVVERSLRYLAQVVLRSYAVYMPVPAGIWREAHTLYEYAEGLGREREAVSPLIAAEGATSVARRYQAMLLLGLSGPYQQPTGEIRNVNRFLDVWADKAQLTPVLASADSVGHFVVDLYSDTPPVAYTGEPLAANTALRMLNAAPVASAAHALLTRAQKGESVRVAPGIECVGDACTGMLRRMVKFWGLSAKRQFSRFKKTAPLQICFGINALHFFANGERPFSPPDNPTDIDQAYIDLDVAPVDAPPQLAAPILRAPETFRVQTWTVRDESASGFSIHHEGELEAHVHVGEAIGVRDEEGIWRVGIVRWAKSAESTSVEMGVEMLAPLVQPVAVKTADKDARYSQALLLPAVAALRKPATLLLPPRMFRANAPLYLVEDENFRELRLITLVERTGAFDQVAFADLRRD